MKDFCAVWKVKGGDGRVLESAMKCPNCDFEIRGITCDTCGMETPEGSLYCHKCGAEIEVEEPPALEDRVLCKDETCTGILNEAGVCGVCGKSFQGEPS